MTTLLPSLADSMQARARIWLLCSFLLAIAAVAGSVAVLISCTEAGAFVAVGVVSIACSTLDEIKCF